MVTIIYDFNILEFRVFKINRLNAIYNAVNNKNTFLIYFEKSDVSYFLRNTARLNRQLRFRCVILSKVKNDI